MYLGDKSWVKVHNNINFADVHDGQLLGIMDTMKEAWKQAY